MTIDGLGGAETIKILDTSGRTLIEDLIHQGETRKTVNIRSLPNGIYLINIQTPDGYSVSQKVIKGK
ncbi:MAG: T9SS type A sorting domain-containing protein [Dyadobacter sp.]|nr:T9SS type A sorting domain-containing protein [Dyadobacter sp.]